MFKIIRFLAGKPFLEKTFKIKLRFERVRYQEYSFAEHHCVAYYKLEGAWLWRKLGTVDTTSNGPPIYKLGPDYYERIHIKALDMLQNENRYSDRIREYKINTLT